MIEKILASIGLTPKEIKVYLTCIRLGPQPASNIARNINISRPSVYDILKNLKKKGLANSQKKANTTLFLVESPENLLNYLEREKESFSRKKDKEKKAIQDILPALKSIERKYESKPKIEFFEGKKGLRQAYEKTLKTKEKIIRAYANVEEMHKGLPEFFPKYYKRRAEQNIYIKTIISNNLDGINRHKQDKKEHRSSKLISAEKFGFSPEVNIFDNKVLYASWKEKMAILIESKEIAEFHEKMFDLLWKKI